MKTVVAVAMWLGTLNVAAQALLAKAPKSASVVYVTKFYSAPCNTTLGVTSTLTGTITQTYCPTCTDQPTNVSAVNRLMTTYTTAFVATCPTGTTLKKYTVTEPCPSPGQPRPSGYIPQGFAVTTVSCNACPTPGPIAITAPVSTPAPAGPSTPVAPPGPPGVTTPNGSPAPASTKGAAPATRKNPAATPVSAPNNQSGAAGPLPGVSSAPNPATPPIQAYTPGSGSTAFRTPWDLLAILTLAFPFIYIL